MLAPYYDTYEVWLKSDEKSKIGESDILQSAPNYPKANSRKRASNVPYTCAL